MLAAGPGFWPTGVSEAHLEPNVGVDSDGAHVDACTSWSSAAWT
jgi:hypothetical protein